MPQDTGFSSLFLKVLLQMLQWLDSPGVEGGPLRAQLRMLAGQASAGRRLSDGEDRARLADSWGALDGGSHRVAKLPGTPRPGEWLGGGGARVDPGELFYRGASLDGAYQ